MSFIFTHGVVRILSRNGKTCGTGFVVHSSGLIATCAHVVEAAEYWSGDTISINFLATGEDRQAVVEKIWWRDPGSEDITILRLLGSLPQNVVTLALNTPHRIEGQNFVTYGFTVDKLEEGLNGKCEVIGQTKENGYPVLQMRSSEITNGFSGAPVVSPNTGKVVGMVTSTIKPASSINLTSSSSNTKFSGELIQQSKISFAIPASALVKICPELENENIQRIITELSSHKTLGELFVDLAVQVRNSPVQEDIQRQPTVVEQGGLDNVFRIMEHQKIDSFENSSKSVIEAVNTSSAVIEKLNQYEKCVLIGKAGAGKTTLVEKLALDSAQRRLEHHNAPLPLLLKLSNWKNEESVLDFVYSHWTYATDPIDTIPTGGAQIYLDGLNEMGSASEKAAGLIREWIHSTNSSKKVIITCRSDDYIFNDLNLDLGLEIVEIEDMSELRIRQFTEKFFNAYRQDPEPFLSEIISSKSGENYVIQNIASNPLMLTALIVSHICHVKEYENDFVSLPKNKGLLFKKLISFLWKWEREHFTPGWVSYTEMEDSFSKLAFKMIEDDLGTEVEQSYAENNCRLSPSFLEVAKSAHIIDIDGENMRFYHQSMQEFFAAVEMKRIGFSTKLQKLKFDKGGRKETKWDQVIITLCNISSNPDQVIDQVLKEGDFYLAAICICNDSRVSQAYVDRTVTGLVKLTENAWLDYAGRLAAADKALEKIGSSAIPSLRQILDNEEVKTSLKTRVVEILGSIGDSSVIPSLGKLLNSQKEKASLKISIVKALESISDQAAIPYLVEARQKTIDYLRTSAVDRRELGKYVLMLGLVIGFIGILFLFSPAAIAGLPLLKNAPKWITKTLTPDRKDLGWQRMLHILTNEHNEKNKTLTEYDHNQDLHYHIEIALKKLGYELDV